MLVSSINIKDNGNYKNLLDLFFPIGSVYFTITNRNPGAYLGGSWIQINNRTCGSLLGIAGTINNKDWVTQIADAGKTNGSMVLRTANMPAHTHTGPLHAHAQNPWTMVVAKDGFSVSAPDAIHVSGKGEVISLYHNKIINKEDKTTEYAGTGATSSTGGGQSMMPYHYSVYAWRRVS